MKNKLFHYTKAETLKLILESKKLRFSSLSKLDDKEEQWTSDMQNHGKHIFVCCFTDDEKESIPIWDMYCNKGSGVRLGFEGKIFSEYKGDILKGSDEDKGIVIIPRKKVIKVEYTDDEDKLYPKIKKLVNGSEIVDISIMGKYKNTYWNFQNEYRYALVVYNYLENGDEVYANDIPFDTYDVPIDEESLNNMVVTLGYNMNYNEKQEV